MAGVKSKGSRDLKNLRTRIDAIDVRLQALITRRARLAQQVATVKRARSTGPALYYRPEREAEVLRKVRARHEGPLTERDMTRLFREIMSACLAAEGPLVVAFLGPAGTYTEQAAFKHFGKAVTASPCSSIDAVFQAVESGSAGFGIVPVENSAEGAVTYTLDRFVQSPLRICGEVELRVRHALLGHEGAAVRTIVAHPQALAQCRRWLDQHFPKARRVACASNGEAAERAARQRGLAAIASRTTAAVYGLDLLATGIEDEPNNTTRFLVIGEQDPGRTGTDKTTLLLGAANRPGALAALLRPLARRNISMSRIESRPARQGLWEYVFFLDIEGHVLDAPIAEALRELEREVAFFKWLGSYPRAQI